MSKKKQKKKHRNPNEEVKNWIDLELDQEYGRAYEQIQEMNRELYIADQRALLRMRKQLEKGKFVSDERLKARVEVIKRAQKESFFDRLKDLIVDVCEHRDVLSMFARVVRAFLISLLSLDTIKQYVPPTILEKIDTVYKATVKFA